MFHFQRIEYDIIVSPPVPSSAPDQNQVLRSRERATVRLHQGAGIQPALEQSSHERVHRASKYSSIESDGKYQGEDESRVFLRAIQGLQKEKDIIRS